MNIDSASSAERCWGEGGLGGGGGGGDGAEKRGRRLGPTVIMTAIMMMVMTASVISPHDGSHPSIRVHTHVHAAAVSNT